MLQWIVLMSDVCLNVLKVSAKTALTVKVHFIQDKCLQILKNVVFVLRFKSSTHRKTSLGQKHETTNSWRQKDAHVSALEFKQYWGKTTAQRKTAVRLLWNFTPFFKPPVAKYQNCYLHMNYASVGGSEENRVPTTPTHPSCFSVGWCVCLFRGLGGGGYRHPSVCLLHAPAARHGTPCRRCGALLPLSLRARTPSAHERRLISWPINQMHAQNQTLTHDYHNMLHFWQKQSYHSTAGLILKGTKLIRRKIMAEKWIC